MNSKGVQLLLFLLLLFSQNFFDLPSYILVKYNTYTLYGVSLVHGITGMIVLPINQR